MPYHVSPGGQESKCRVDVSQRKYRMAKPTLGTWTNHAKCKGDNVRRSKRFCFSVVLYVSFTWKIVKTRELRLRVIERFRTWRQGGYRVFTLTWPASMQIHWNKRKRLHKKGVQLPQDWFGTPTWPPFHCFGTPIWPPWRHVKTLYIGVPNQSRGSWTFFFVNAFLCSNKFA